ncbi:putative dehydrogenase [Escherichia coli]|uniref:Putative dehydrogenase n=1 Tax=Escherichia coli TaxID=562 RepID=A0A377K2Q0_ECOLX|nr:putative dehydrogenase [Escherichia coli]
MVAALATSIPIFIRHWRTTFVYAADRAGLVKALNADDGKEIWSVNLAEKDGWFSKDPALLSGGVTVSGGHVYIGTEKAQVYALNTSDGTVAWQTKVAGESTFAPGGQRRSGVNPHQ